MQQISKCIMKNLKIVKILLLLLLILTSCNNKSVREDIVKRFPTNKIDTLLSFDFDKNQIPDNICILSHLNKQSSIYDSNQSVVLYMNNEFISINNKILPKSKLGRGHMINLENRNNSLLINDEFSIARPTSNYKLIFRYNENLKKIVLDSFKISVRAEKNNEMPYYKLVKNKKISRNEIYTLENGDFLTKDSLDFKDF